MEIFNTLPNDINIKILLIFGTFVENILIMYLFLAIQNITVTIKQKALYLLCMVGISLITLFLIPSPFNTYINLIFPIILAHAIFHETFLRSLIFVGLSLITINLLGFLLLNPVLTLLNISSDQLANTFEYRHFYMQILYFFTLVIICVLKCKNYKFNFSDDIDKKNKTILVCNLTFGVITIVIQSITLFYYVDSLPLIITFLNFITLLVFFIFSIYSLTKLLTLFSTTQKLESVEAYNKSLRVLHDNVRGFKHDFDNIITTIGGYIKTNDMKGLENYYSQLGSDCQKVNNLYLLSPTVVNNDGIYNLLTRKYNEADSKGIKVNISFLLDLSDLHMQIYEFARILGILLDNAIEASQESTEKIMNLTFRNDSKNSRQLVIIENSYKDKDVDTEKIYEKGISSKDNHTGIGLWTVRKILKRTNNINLYTSKNPELFSQQLEIYY